MILKIPIYVETPGSFTPEEVEILQRSYERMFRDSYKLFLEDKKFKVKNLMLETIREIFSDRAKEIDINILSDKEVFDRIFTNISKKKKESPPQKVTIRVRRKKN